MLVSQPSNLVVLCFWGHLILADFLLSQVVWPVPASEEAGAFADLTCQPWGFTLYAGQAAERPGRPLSCHARSVAASKSVQKHSSFAISMGEHDDRP